MNTHNKEQIAKFFNTSTDTLGNFLLHVCANYGSCEPCSKILAKLRPTDKDS